MHKIGRLRAYAILILALAVQLTVLGRFRIMGARPDLVLACVVFFGLFLGRYAGLEAGLAAGLMEDLFALDYFGINMVILALTGLVAGSLNTSFVRESKRTQVIIVFACAAVSMCSHYALASALSGAFGFGMAEYIRSSVLPAGAYTAAVSVPIFMWFRGAFEMEDTDELL